jgi:hypothetical protein
VHRYGVLVFFKKWFNKRWNSTCDHKQRLLQQVPMTSSFLTWASFLTQASLLTLRDAECHKRNALLPGRRCSIMASSKGMGIKTSVKSGNFRSTKAGAGMTEKGVKAFRKANPGSKLKTAVTEDKPSPARAARRKSFCARSAGQMKKFPKAAKDPDSRLRQARKRWKC